MSLPLWRIAAGRDGGWRRAGAGLFLVLALGFAGPPAHADDADPYSATVTVDATADSVIKARDAARLDGQRRALAAVVQQLAGGNAPPKLPKLDDQAITNLVASFAVANERMSAVRYVADYTFHFQPTGIRHLMGNAGIAVAAEPGKPLIVLPVYQSGGAAALWDDPNPWREAWENPPAASGAARFVVPLGDAGDIAAIDADKARAGDSAALAVIARHNGTDDVLVALAIRPQPAGDSTGLDVTVRRYHAGQLVATHAVPLDAKPGESEADLLRRGIAGIVAGVAGGWKNDTATNGPQGTLTAVLPIGSLDDWLHARERLSGVPAIRKVSLMALSRQEATIEIGYVGGIDQLKAGLAAISLDLTPGGPMWRLARSAAERSP
ncbi:MAG TPA: DUF2066 domain-containing protein [Stellaceae bacterium]|nr:DUF2066 domain-containing protein [Stellaceae bacterium]